MHVYSEGSSLEADRLADAGKFQTIELNSGRNHGLLDEGNLLCGVGAAAEVMVRTARRLLVRGGHLLTMDSSLGDVTGDLLVEDGVIRAVAPSIDGGDAQVVDGLKRVYGFSRVAV